MGALQQKNNLEWMNKCRLADTHHSTEALHFQENFLSLGKKNSFQDFISEFGTFLKGANCGVFL